MDAERGGRFAHQSLTPKESTQFFQDQQAAAAAAAAAERAAAEQQRLLALTNSLQDFRSKIEEGRAGLAEGGNVQRGGMVKVGERGPELLNLPRGAQVTPLARGGGGRATTVNLNFYGDVLTNEDFDERGERGGA